MRTTFMLSADDPTKLLGLVQFVESAMDANEYLITFGVLNFKTVSCHVAQSHLHSGYEPTEVRINNEEVALLFRLKFNDVIIGEERTYEEAIN